MYIHKKLLTILILGVASMVTAAGALRAEDMPCNAPPFLGTTVMPNILILQDNSGSMNSWAYYGITFNQDSSYYGYFRNDKNYTYSSNVFHPSTCTPDAYLLNGCWPGNLLNWATMTRRDIAKKVLVGGKAKSRQGNVHTLIAETNWSDGWRYFYWHGRSFKRYLSAASPSKVYIYDNQAHAYRIYGARVQVEVADTFTRGIIQQIADKNNDYQWDDNIPRFGLFIFNTSEGGHVECYIGEPTLNNFISAVENLDFNTWTPLAESYYEALRYFGQDDPYYYNNDYTKQIGGVKDPYYDKDLKEIVWCRKSFVIVITDGESTKDEDIPGWLRDFDHDGNDASNINGSGGTDYLDDVALWGHNTDLRAGAANNIPGEQNVILYTVYSFGNSSRAVQLLQDAAKNGAFIDKNGNNKPDLQEEWDTDGNGVPDAYFKAQNGYQLERSIRKAIEDILQRVGAASAVTIVSNTSKGEGLAMQAFFLPKLTSGGIDYYWLGSVVSYWIDEYGNLREDTNNNLTLDNSDYIVRFTMSGNETRVVELQDNNNDGVPDDTVGMVPLTQLGIGLNAVFNAGEKLYNTNYSSRNIYTYVPGTGLTDFNIANKNKFENFLDVDLTKVDTVIDYVRGEDFAGYRRRDIEQQSNTWKLGDIIYATPLIVGAPQERYDKIYRDNTYREYFNANRNRRNVAYIGANDGMLHVVNAGIFDRVNKKINPAGYDVGSELWAYIPFNLLPHLKWLMDPDYCHVYYVDLPPKASDLRIFSDDANHKDRWGTVLFGGMRFGGYPVDVDGTTMRSSYFALDVTVPTSPSFMWEFNDDDLGYTTNKPAIIKVDSSWYVILTSGPTDFDGNSDHEAYVYILDAKTGNLLRKFEANENDAYMGPPAVVDVNIDYNADVVYIGESYVQGNNEKGKVYRLTLTDPNTGKPTTDVNNWNLSILLDDVPSSVTAKLNASMDAEGHLWVFGGTGRYWSDADEQTTPTNFLFGIKDDGWRDGAVTYGSGSMLDATNIAVKVDTSTGASRVYGVLSDTASFSSFETWASSNYQGWYINISAERDLNMPLVLGGAVFYTTFIPTDDPCGFGGTSYLYGLYYKTGTGYQKPILGTNTSNEALRKVSLGTGMASAPAAHLATNEANAQVVVQTSTGQIIQTSTPLPFKVKSGARIWRGLLF